MNGKGIADGYKSTTDN